MADWFKNLFGGEPEEAPAAAPAPADVSDPEPAAPAPEAVAAPEPAPAEPVAAALSLSAEQIEAFGPADVVKTLHEAIETTPDINTMLIELCCKRLRVLCRDPENCKACDESGTARAVVLAMSALPNSPSVQLQALAALVNLCSGEANEHRKNAVDAGAMKAIVESMNSQRQNAEVQEMACIALQNCCYGEDVHAITRRQNAAVEGALEAVVSAMKVFVASAPMQEVGAATLRLIVHRVAENRTKALELGANSDWVKPIQQGGSGMISFRKFGFSTTRRKPQRD